MGRTKYTDNFEKNVFVKEGLGPEVNLLSEKGKLEEAELLENKKQLGEKRKALKKLLQTKKVNVVKRLNRQVLMVNAIEIYANY